MNVRAGQEENGQWRRGAGAPLSVLSSIPDRQSPTAGSTPYLIAFLAAAGVHLLLLFQLRPDLAQPLALGDEASVVELSIVEAAPEPAATVPVPAEPEPVTPPVIEPMPPEPVPELVPEPMLEPLPEPEPETKPELTKPKPTPPRPPAAARKVQTPAPPRAVVSSATPVIGGASAVGSRAGSERGASTSARPRYRSNPKPNYPSEARRAGHQGVVVIAVEVTADGRAGSVRLSRSSGFPLLDAAAMQAVQRWTFEPARALGIPTASRVEVPVRFDLNR